MLDLCAVPTAATTTAAAAYIAAVIVQRIRRDMAVTSSLPTTSYVITLQNIKLQKTLPKAAADVNTLTAAVSHHE